MAKKKSQSAEESAPKKKAEPEAQPDREIILKKGAMEWLCKESEAERIECLLLQGFNIAEA